MHSFPHLGYVGKTVHLKWAKVLCASPSVQETSEVISLLMNTQTAYSTYTHCAVEDCIIVGFLLCVAFGMHALCQCNMTSHIQHCIVICTEPFHSGLVTDTNAQSYVRLCLAQSCTAFGFWYHPERKKKLHSPEWSVTGFSFTIKLAERQNTDWKLKDEVLLHLNSVTIHFRSWNVFGIEQN